MYCKQKDKTEPALLEMKMLTQVIHADEAQCWFPQSEKSQFTIYTSLNKAGTYVML